MSDKKPAAGGDPGRDPLLRVQLTVPRSLCWMLGGALLGNLHDLGPLLHHIGRLLL